MSRTTRTRFAAATSAALAVSLMPRQANTPLIADLIFKGEVSEIKEVMKRSRNLGMQTFDQSLFQLYDSGKITLDQAIENADSKTDLALHVRLTTSAKPDTSGMEMT